MPCVELRCRAQVRGQPLPRSKALASSLVAHAAISENDMVVEVGPGRGILTLELARRCRAAYRCFIDASFGRRGGIVGRCVGRAFTRRSLA